MKLVVKTLKGTRFEIEVEPQQTVADVKQIIETAQGADVYPASRQRLIHQGKVLTDDTTLEENQVSEHSFLVIMLNKNTDSSPSGGSSTQQGAAAAATSHQAPAPPSPVVAQEAAAVPNLVADNVSEDTVQQIQEMGAGTWDRDTVVRALRAASNNPNRAIEYLYSGIPEQAAQVPAQTVQQESNSQAPNATPLNLFPQGLPSMAPNATPLNLFPQGLPSMASNANALNADAGEDGTYNMDSNNPQLQSLVNMLQANPQMLQALGNPDLMQLLQGNGDNLSSMMNELEGGEEVLEVNLTDEEMQAIERLEAMGFERELVVQVYFACNKNEEQAANYLLDHMDEF